MSNYLWQASVAFPTDYAAKSFREQIEGEFWVRRAPLRILPVSPDDPCSVTVQGLFQVDLNRLVETALMNSRLSEVFIKSLRER